MKKGIAVLLVLVSTGTMVFAGTRGRDNDTRNNYNRNNNQESNYGRMRDDRGGRMIELLDDATIVTLEGKLELVNGEPAKLVSGKTTYTIMAPWDQLIALNVKDGMKVTIEGAEWNSPMVWDQSEKMFVVTKITIDGKSTEIDHDERTGMMGFGMGQKEPRGQGFRN
ncbi:hypothetical protein EW093_10410 [Thiospirochaeta perfilievii]|uniref:Organic solvent tolerance-like N-terminal domain-containing protein n=1 Tax=Thiospirochaeta perfilievii TaxID=252967 RepID=A0A5C1QAM2_9SPIO|nr:hypothetical protein [Thiospirochaeta perfilievii]QEN05105.1 hypothetical protein EW093_10410 [Thiospirochaeta perfilievii]